VGVKAIMRVVEGDEYLEKTKALLPLVPVDRFTNESIFPEQRRNFYVEERPAKYLMA
jgi:hypothetical protein